MYTNKYMQLILGGADIDIGVGTSRGRKKKRREGGNVGTLPTPT